MKSNPTPTLGDPVEAIRAYHEQTKHHPERYARGPQGLDWASQPKPFRRFSGAPAFPLPLSAEDDTPGASILFAGARTPPRTFTLANLGLFFELSLGLSARKEIAASSWYLRVNPSSGNLHPTEAYVILPTIEGLSGGAGVYHYAPLAHALEQRARCAQPGIPDTTGFHLGLSSIVWREAWKYGERAFRYCQHDVGHALAAIRFAAATLGWRVQLVQGFNDAELARLLGLDRADDFAEAEQETPELMIQVMVNEAPEAIGLPSLNDAVAWFGRANQLSVSHLEWPVIAEAIAASERINVQPDTPESSPRVAEMPPPVVGGHSAGRLIRQRRSAVDFDGVTRITRETFLAILEATLPRGGAPPFDAWPFSPRLHLVVFVHRVNGLEPGLYLWLRTPADESALRAACQVNFDWEAIGEGAPHPARLYRLRRGDLRGFARTLSCQQDIAADGAFSLGMLARFEPTLRERGAAAYRELFWEAGMIGQALYLAAEAAAVRGTGIGCYFDDMLHRALGLAGDEWQSLYHFTIGGPVEDPRLRTIPPYSHRVP